ncbi:MAG: YceI family protein [Chloroflexi bacterium]|nr:YceI family protein [Chloroflexota bacterium]
MGKWVIDSEHTVAHFVARHMMITDVHGQFNKISGFIYFDAANAGSLSAEIEIDAKELWTGVERRDNHLRSADFLDVEKYPKILFKSTRTEIAGSNMLEVHGEITIRGITRPITLNTEYFGPVQYEDETGSYTTMGFHATTHLHREDFGMIWNNYFGPGNFMAGKLVRITLNGEVDLSDE